MSQFQRLQDGTVLPDIETLTGNAGGAVGPDALFNINIVGAGACTVTGVPATNTLTIAVAGGGLVWTREAGAAVPVVANHGYINTNVGLTTFTLPALAVVGDILEIAGESAAFWRIAQNAGQNVQVGNLSTTIGVGGSITASNRYDTIRLVCRVANTTWSATSFVGVPNIV